MGSMALADLMLLKMEEVALCLFSVLRPSPGFSVAVLLHIYRLQTDWTRMVRVCPKLAKEYHVEVMTTMPVFTLPLRRVVYVETDVIVMHRVSVSCHISHTTHPLNESKFKYGRRRN